MGYLPHQSLKIFDSTGTNEIHPDESEKIIKHLIEFYELDYALDESGDCVESCKWYSHTQDLRLFSKTYPDVVFELHGEGEETGDIWNEYFKDGQSQREQAKFTIDPYDPSKLI